MDELETQLGMTRDRWLDQRQAWGLTIDRWTRPAREDIPAAAFVALAYWKPARSGKARLRVHVVAGTLDAAIAAAVAREAELG